MINAIKDPDDILVCGHCEGQLNPHANRGFTMYKNIDGDNEMYLKWKRTCLSCGKDNSYFSDINGVEHFEVDELKEEVTLERIAFE